MYGANKIIYKDLSNRDVRLCVCVCACQPNMNLEMIAAVVSITRAKQLLMKTGMVLHKHETFVDIFNRAAKELAQTGPVQVRYVAVCTSALFWC